MKITRRQIRKVIKEALAHEVGTIYVVADKKEVASDNASAIKVSDISQEKLISKLGITSAKGKNPHYVWTQSEFPTMRNISSILPTLDISPEDALGETRSIYEIGKFTSGRGDPFTFDKISNGKYRVISGPISKSIGKIYSIPDENLSPSPEVETPERQRQMLFVNDLQDYANGRFHGNSNLQNIYMNFAKLKNPELDNLSDLPKDLVKSLDSAFKPAVDFITDGFLQKNIPSKSDFMQVLVEAGFPPEINDDLSDYMQKLGLVVMDADTPAVTRSLDEGSKRISRSQLRKIISSVIF